MRKMVLLFSAMILAAACSPNSSSTSTISEQAPALSDVATPDDVAEELGLAPMQTSDASVATALDSGDVVESVSLEDQNRIAGIDVTQYFPVVIVVNKAAKGPSAQSMKVYHRGVLKYTFPVSTGREQQENNTKSGRVYTSTTPTGWYAPTRTYASYFSTLWQAQMDNAVFFNGGIAMHATTRDHFKELGQRASGGCVRLHPTNAKIVYDLVLAEGKGEVPVYTRTGQITIEGLWKKRVKTQQNWNTLIIVEENENR